MRSIRIAQTATFAGLALATFLLASKLDSGKLRPYDVGIVPKASTLRWVSLGHPTLAANLLWLQAVQYIGEPRGSERGWGKLYPLVDTITDLDPRHGYAYQVAGTLLSSFGHVPESSAILEKGARTLHDRYILPLLRAYNAFYYDDDWEAAGRFAEMAARAKGAPDHVRHYALAFYVKGQRADAAVAFLEQSLSETRDPETRKAVEGQLQQALLERNAARVEEAIRAWRDRFLAGPMFLGQLVEEKFLDAIPADPFGGELYVDQEGRVRSTANPYRFARPESMRQDRPRPGPAPGGPAP
jgi:tetratricopeptide (TPR) repeat protein